MVLALGLLMIGVLARFLPHVPNFSPVMAIALFGSVYLRRSQALWVPLLLMIVTDMFLGFHAVIPFTWGSILLVSFIGLWVRKNMTPVKVMASAVVSAVAFFIITNFGVWLAFYPQTREGFVSCYAMAIPFFRMDVLSTLVYTAVLFGTYELVARRVKGTRFEFALLNK